jgi:predicted transcriptional regulator
MTMENVEFGKLLAFFQALGNESRPRIVGLLANGEMSVGALARQLDLKEPTVSHHLNKLKELELVTMRADGVNHIYRLDLKALENLNRDIYAVARVSAAAEVTEGDEFERRVMKAFTRNGRIREIPTQYKKQQVITRWLVKAFEPGRRYPEAEVNEVLKGFHEDFASLRRFLVEDGLMAREGGIYWRLEQ